MREAKLKVTLANPDEVKDTLYKTGLFVKNSYDSKDNFENIGRHCIKVKHGSAMRRVHFVFDIEGVSRVFSHQQVRHNTGVAHNQRSQRYCNESDFKYIIPKTIKLNPESLEHFIQAMNYANEKYKILRQLKIPYEDARYVLPNACETKITTIFSLQALIHFCHERLCNRAEDEIRQVATEMVKEVRSVVPEISDFLVPKCIDLGYCPEGSQSCGKYPLKEEVLTGYWRLVAGNQDG